MEKRLVRDYVLRRLAALIPTLLLASLIVFGSMRLIPGDVIDLMMAQNDIATAQDREAIEAALGFDKPLHEQYVEWLTGVLTGDLGRSLWQNTPVAEQAGCDSADHFRAGAACAAGFDLAWRADRHLFRHAPGHRWRLPGALVLTDYAGGAQLLARNAGHGFSIGVVALVAAAGIHAIFRGSDSQSLSHMLVPAIMLGLAISAVTMRMTRTMMLEVMRQDYIRTARAKGLSERTVVVRHALRNGLIPVVTLIGLQAPLLIGGAVILEQIFVVPGMGLLLLEAVFQRDYPVISGVFLVTGVGILLHQSAGRSDLRLARSADAPSVSEILLPNPVTARVGPASTGHPTLAFTRRLIREKPLGAVGGAVFLLFLIAGALADVIAPYG
jgi:peptide/nickel transport system permease protein